VLGIWEVEGVGANRILRDGRVLMDSGRRVRKLWRRRVQKALSDTHWR
jgi:hypothetical protein